MKTEALKIIYGYISRYRKMQGHTPTAEHLVIIFDKPLADMRTALASYLEAQS